MVKMRLSQCMAMFDIICILALLAKFGLRPLFEQRTMASASLGGDRCPEVEVQMEGFCRWFSPSALWLL